MQTNDSDEKEVIKKDEPRLKAYRLILWLGVVLLAVGYSMYIHYANKNTVVQAQTQSNMEKAPATIVMTGRYVLGAKSFYSMMSNPGADDLSEKLILQLKDNCRNTTDQTVIIPFIAELAGARAAQEYIDDLKEDNHLTESLAIDLETFEKIYQDGPDTLEAHLYERLIDRHQWIAKVALSHGLSPTDDFRINVMKPAKRTFMVIVAFMSTVLMAGAAGLILLIVAIVMLFHKRLSLRFQSQTEFGTVQRILFLETVIVFLAVIIVMNILGGGIPRILFWVLYLVFSVSAILWPVWRGMGFTLYMNKSGWHKGSGWIREIGSGFVGYLAGLPIIICGVIATFVIIKYSGVQPTHPIVHQFRDAGFIKIVFLLLMACVMAPLLEEALFRGVLYRYLRFGHSALVSTFFTGGLFAVIHPQGFAAFPVLAALGGIFALIREWRDSLIGPVIAHALNNFVITMLLVVSISNA